MATVTKPGFWEQGFQAWGKKTYGEAQWSIFLSCYKSHVDALRKAYMAGRRATMYWRKKRR